MSRPSRRAQRFVRRLLEGMAAHRHDGVYRLDAGDGSVSLSADEVAALISAGVLSGNGDTCRSNAGSAGWLRRAMLDTDAHAGQHRDLQKSRGQPAINLNESPLLRLASVAAGESEPFLSPHQVTAGERVRRLVERAALGPRLTMRYEDRPIGGGGNPGADIGDMAADARRTLATLHAILPRDCAGVVMDVCGALKGLQQIESERGWPRRSAKLVLRIGLDRLAEHWGMAEVAIGPERGRMRGEMAGDRLPL